MTREMHDMLSGAAAGFQHVTGLAGQKRLQHRPDRLMVAVERGRIEPSIRLPRLAILAELCDILRHRALLGSTLTQPHDHDRLKACNTAWFRAPSRCIAPTLPPDATRLSCTLPIDRLCAFHSLILRYCDGIIEIEARETPLIANFSKPALVLALLAAAGMAAPAQAQSAAEGQKLAFDRGKGNCLTCHVIKGGDLPGTIGPALTDLKKKYSRDELTAIVSDETKRNPLTVMPPFGRNRILTEKEISAVVDFLQTL